MLDTNVLISAIILESSSMKAIVEDVALNHDLLIGSYVLDELRDVVKRKWPARIKAIERFIHDAALETVETPPASELFCPNIRDPKDQSVLAEAISGKVDILITGDKDFENIGLATPEIISPRQYITRFIESHSVPPNSAY